MVAQQYDDTMLSSSPLAQLFSGGTSDEVRKKALSTSLDDMILAFGTKYVLLGGDYNTFVAAVKDNCEAMTPIIDNINLAKTGDVGAIQTIASELGWTTEQVNQTFGPRAALWAHHQSEPFPALQGPTIADFLAGILGAGAGSLTLRKRAVG